MREHISEWMYDDFDYNCNDAVADYPISIQYYIHMWLCKLLLFNFNAGLFTLYRAMSFYLSFTSTFIEYNNPIRVIDLFISEIVIIIYEMLLPVDLLDALYEVRISCSYVFAALSSTTSSSIIVDSFIKPHLWCCIYIILLTNAGFNSKMKSKSSMFIFISNEICKYMIFLLFFFHFLNEVSFEWRRKI